MRIIGLTGDTRIEQKEAAIAAGLNDYVTKPYQRETVLQVLQQYARLSVYLRMWYACVCAIVHAYVCSCVKWSILYRENAFVLMHSCIYAFVSCVQ